MIRVLAPAKINPFLSVGGVGPDGLHELVSVMQSVSLYDELEIARADVTSLRVEPDDVVAAGDDNLVVRAARAYLASQGLDEPVAMTLRKAIPVAAGLGGGSSDAAATLIALNELHGRRVSRKALERIAVTLGSDVPFCVRGGTCVVAGTGENLSVLVCDEPVWWVLGISDARLPTAEVYREFDRLGGGAVGDPYEVADAMARGEVERLAASLRNDLEPAALSLMPDLARGRDALLEAGALAVVLAGSGPTWCALASDETAATSIAERATAAFARVETVRSLPHGPRVVG